MRAMRPTHRTRPSRTGSTRKNTALRPLQNAGPERGAIFGGGRSECDGKLRGLVGPFPYGRRAVIAARQIECQRRRYVGVTLDGCQVEVSGLDLDLRQTFRDLDRQPRHAAVRSFLVLELEEAGLLDGHGSGRDHGGPYRRVVAQRQRDAVGRGVEAARRLRNERLDLQAIVAAVLAEFYRCLGDAQLVRVVPDRRCHRALLDRRRNVRIAALGVRIFGIDRASDTERVAQPLAPTADGILEDAHVVERVKLRIEIGILPDRAQSRESVRGIRFLAGGFVDAGAVLGIAGNLVDLLERLTVVDPALDHLDVLQRRAGTLDGSVVHHRHDRKARRLLAEDRTDVAAHRLALVVTFRDEILAVGAEVERVASGERAHDRARAARRVRLLAAQGREDRIARILFGPHDREAAGIRLDLRRRSGFGQDEGRLRVGDAAEADRTVVDLADRTRNAVVRVGASDESELVRVHAGDALDDQTLLEGAARIRVLREFLVPVRR